MRQAINASQARKQFFSIIRDQVPVEVNHKDGCVVILPKAEFEQMERELVRANIERIRNSGQKIISGQEAETRLAQALNHA